MDCFKIDHVQYKPDVYEGITVSSSEIITSLERSITAIEYIEIYAQNHDLDFMKMILDMDAFSYYSMNIIDYLVGNTDRHWGNWGVWIDNNTNKILGLHPLMDFNKAFTSYDSIDGALCQTHPGHYSQKDAAIEAVNQIGLNQLSEVDKEWFSSKEQWLMFNERLDVLRNVQHPKEEWRPQHVEF